MAYNHFITITDLGQTTAWELLLHAKKIKDHKSQNQCMQGKTDYGHPCQVMSDLLTIYEQTPNIEDIHIAWIGDGNNVLNSWIEAAMYFPFKLTIATPNGYEPRIEHIEFAKKIK